MYIFEIDDLFFILIVFISIFHLIFVLIRDCSIITLSLRRCDGY